MSTEDTGYTLTGIDSTYGEVHELDAPWANRTFPVIVFIPQNAPAQKTFPVLYLLHGMNKQPINEEGIRSIYNRECALQEAANEFQTIIAAPLLGNHYYLDLPDNENYRYGTWVANNLVSFIEKITPANRNRKARFIGGFSMGGYGAVSLACRHPNVFSTALSRCGVLDLGFGPKYLDWEDAVFTLDILGSYHKNQALYEANGCTHLLESLSENAGIHFIIEAGSEDFLLKANEAFHEKLKSTAHSFDYELLPVGHAWDKSVLISFLKKLNDAQA